MEGIFSVSIHPGDECFCWFRIARVVITTPEMIKQFRKRRDLPAFNTGFTQQRLPDKHLSEPCVVCVTTDSPATLQEDADTSIR